MKDRVMLSSADLQFDKMEVNTKLAQEYLKSNPHFRSIGYDSDDGDEEMFDAGSYKIFHKKFSDLDIQDKQWTNRSPCPGTLTKLAVEIEENIYLFCSLENLIRGKSSEATELELRMIIKHLRYVPSLHTCYRNACSTLLMMDNRPLIDLGFITHLAPSMTIIANETTAVVCSLFTHLCRNSGLDVRLAILKKSEIKDGHNVLIESKAKALSGGCIGVVTAQADVDSALDSFLAAPNGDVWGIRRVLVEESASERLTSALSWKTRGRKANEDWPCTEAYAFEDRTFLREYAGKDTDLENVVLVESFRTVKELIALVESYSPFCVSLWSASVAQSNEIALGISAPMVWVNDYGTIGDPNFVSLAYFSQLVPPRIDDLLLFGEVRKLQQQQKDWVKLTYDQRSSKLKDVVSTIEQEECVSYLSVYQTGPLTNIVQVGASDMIIGICKPLDLYFINLEQPSMTCSDAIKRLLSGSGLVIGYWDKPKYDFYSFYNELAEAGLPVELVKYKDPNKDNLELSLDKSLFYPEPYRIVHTNFGTIFAN